MGQILRILTVMRAGLLLLLFIATRGAQFYHDGQYDAVPHREDLNFLEWRFRDSVSRALNNVNIVLNQTRDTPLLGETDHQYSDKYAMMEYLTDVWISTQITAWQRIGLRDSALETALDWARATHPPAITIAWQGSQHCELIKEYEITENAGDTETTTESTVSALGTSSTTTKKTTSNKTRQMFLWNHSASYQISVCRGLCSSRTSIDEDSNDDLIVLRQAKVSQTLDTYSKNPPRANFGSESIERLNIQWLLQNIDPETKRGRFRIDRSAKTCRTPSRNDEITEALTFRRKLVDWLAILQQFFSFYDTEFMQISSAKGVLHPVLPFMENKTLFSAATVNDLIKEHATSIEQGIRSLPKEFTSPDAKNASVLLEEATIVFMCQHLQQLGTQYGDSVAYIENLLREQLFEAIGKAITPHEFKEYMHFHERKLYETSFSPRPISHAIRQPGRYPVGIVSIENLNGEPIHAFVKDFNSNLTQRNETTGIKIPISASIAAELTGPQYLTGWIQHHFNGQNNPPLFLAARARQFSSMLLFVGTMASHNHFHPKHAIILKNKDEVLIPLLTKPLASAKDFKDSISSLSPEQQAFAKAYRGMQLESSVFAIGVVQLKPQLEVLLGLPEGALIKEIQLTEDLIHLFVDYQIPSDLLAFDGETGLNVTDKVVAVKGYVKAVLDMIEKTKEKQFEDQKRKIDLKHRFSTPMQTSLTGQIDQDFFPPSKPPNSIPTDIRGFATSETFTPTATGRTVRRKSDIREKRPKDLDYDTMQQASTFTKDKSNTGSERTTALLLSSTNDFTLIPKTLDAKLEIHDTKGYLRSNIISVDASGWRLSRQQDYLTEKSTTLLSTETVKSETKKAFDLLDALSRSGTLPLESSELHVIVGLTHFFPNSIIATIVEDNVNPIEKAEFSSLLLSSTIHSVEVEKVISDLEDRKRLSKVFPAIFTTTTSTVLDKETREDTYNQANHEGHSNVAAEETREAV